MEFCKPPAPDAHSPTWFGRQGSIRKERHQVLMHPENACPVSQFAKERFYPLANQPANQCPHLLLALLQHPRYTPCVPSIKCAQCSPYPPPRSDAAGVRPWGEHPGQPRQAPLVSRNLTVLARAARQHGCMLTSFPTSAFLDHPHQDTFS